MAHSALGPRVLLRRLREVMAEPDTAQKRLDKIATLIAVGLALLPATGRRALALGSGSLASS